MTTHYQKIQALGNKMVSNLESMGVSANFNDGGMTLADKILEIQHFSNGIKLYTDDNTGNIGDEINLYALALENGVFQPNKIVSFPSESTSKTYPAQAQVNESLGTAWKIKVNNGHVEIGSGANKLEIMSYGYVSITINSTNFVYSGNFGNEIIYYDGMLYNNNGNTIDVSSYTGINFAKLYQVYANTSITFTPIAITDLNGIASYTYTCTSGGNKNITASYKNFQDQITLIVSKENSNLTLIPPTLTYSDIFSVTGTLKDSNNNGIDGATITLNWQIGSGTVQTATATTNSEGTVTFYRDAPTSINTYKFWLSYTGDDSYNASTSSESTVEVNKEISVLNVTSPVENQIVMQGNAIHFEGTLLDNDGAVISNAQLRIICHNDSTNSSFYDNYINVNSDGSFSADITNQFAVGTGQTNMVIYNGNSYYTNTYKTIYITSVADYDGIEIINTGDCILSYADEDTVTLTAQLKKGNNAANVSGVNIDFYDVTDSNNPIKLNSSDISTNSSGRASYTYTSQGKGDITIKACVGPISGTLLSQTYEVEDCRYYNDGTKLTDLTIESGVSCTIEDGAIKITTSSNGEKYVTYPPTFTNSDNFIIEFEIAGTGSNQRTGFWLNTASTANGLWCSYEISQSKFSGGLKGTSINYPTTCSVGDIMKIQQQNGVISVYHNSDELISKTTSFTSNTYQFGNYTNNGRVQYLKNIKIKPL